MCNFSVLISVYYKELPSNLIDCLDSVFRQSFLPQEVILVKDGTLTKDLDSIIEFYSLKTDLLKIISLPRNVGLGNALNEGLKYCSFDLVARMDSDDISKYDRFEKQIKIFQTYPNIDLVGSWINEFEGNISNVISTRKLPEIQDDIYRFAKKRCPVNHPVVMFKKQSVLNVGGYIHFPLFEDYYLWVRMLLNGSQFYNCQESLLYFRLSSDMYKRRGGFVYACNEIKLQLCFFDLGFISVVELIRNILIRFILRLLPNKLRAFLYKKLLR